MAEAFAAVGLASSIVAFVDFAQKVVSRLNEFSGDLTDATNAPAQIQTRLPIIIDGLRRIRDRVDSGNLDDGAKAALQPIVQACHRQVETLSDILDSVLPASDASRWERRKKAIQSLKADSKVKRASEILSQNLQSLTFYHSIGDPVSQPVAKTAFWLVPFDRNQNFVGRESIFDQVDLGFKVTEGSQPKVALYGLGGIGKTQIALEYCFRKRHKQPRCSIFWVNAATVARFEESFQRMAKEFSLNDGQDPQKDNLASVKAWLETELVDPWVMIIDNVDDETAFFRDKCHNDKAPSQVLPCCSHGQLLFTSRTRDVAMDLASPGTPLSVDFLTREEGLDLLRKRLGPDPTDDHLIELLTELSHIPLAITQAISFILKRRKSVEQYLKLYRMGEKSMSRLLSHEFLDHGRQERTMESVTRTWQISFEWIKKNDPKAVEILCFMGFYQHHGVPERLLRSGDEDDFEFEDGIAILQAFSLLEVDKDKESYSTHRLIQVTTKLWLEQNEPARLEEWSLRALSRVTRCFPHHSSFRQDDYWMNCQSLLPHADILLGKHFTIYERESDLQKAVLLNHTGFYILWAELDLQDVQGRYKKSFDLRQRHLGSDHFHTWSIKAEYFRLLVRPKAVYPPGMDSHAVAEMGRVLLSHRREALGPRHPETIMSMSNIALLLNKEGKFEESETMQREALKLSQEVQGHQHPRTVECMESLAEVLMNMGRFGEAAEIWRSTTNINSEYCGPAHRATLTSKHNLAFCLLEAGRPDEAIPLSREIMTLGEKNLGPDHHLTLLTTKHLAFCFRDQKRYKEALDVVDYILDILQASRRVYAESITAKEIMEFRQGTEEEMKIDSNFSESSVATGE